MNDEIVTALIGLFCTIVSSVVTFILTRRKYDTEVDSQQIDNVEKSFDIYKKVMEETLAQQDKKIAALQKENEDLKKQVNQLQMQVIRILGKCPDANMSKEQ